MPSDLSPDPLAFIASPPKPFLIEPPQRLRFALLFTFLTLLSGLMAVALSWGLALGLYGRLPEAIVGIGRQWLEWILVGGAVGSGQWLILRRYIPSQFWIGATALGWIVANAVAASSLDNSGEFLSHLAFVWLGFAQWLVLRQFAKPAWFWILLPCVASFGSFVVSLLLQAAASTAGELGALLLPIASQFTVLGAVQAIALCTLRQQGRSHSRRGSKPDSSSITPEITNLEQLRSLAQQLQAQLNQTTIAKIAADPDLIYLVDVTEDGAIAMYQPVNQAAFDYADQTPLPTLLAVSESPQTEASQQKSLARLQVIFQAGGTLAIRSADGEMLI
ncbi:MAG: hypothetical protein KME12_17560 [Trichocoleus desertorum ATA4-8-CV12]|jgi:hypothetical protein|nr:hypothetical protein [Trichocoleus desertorum ATA4-8-CV12]